MRRHFRISRIVLQPATSQTFAFRMDSQLDNRNRKPLVTVEFQTEVDIATGNRERRLFVKMYFDARDSGLLAALPDELWNSLFPRDLYGREWELLPESGPPRQRFEYKARAHEQAHQAAAGLPIPGRAGHHDDKESRE